MNTFIYFLSAFCAALFGIRIAQKPKQGQATKAYLLLCILITIAFICFGSYLIFENQWLRRIFYVSICALPVSILHFAYHWQVQRSSPVFFTHLGILFVGIFLGFELAMPEHASLAEGAVLIWFFLGSCYCAFSLYRWMNQSSDNIIRYRRLRHLLILFLVTLTILSIEGTLRYLLAEGIANDDDFWRRSSVLQGISPPVGTALSILCLYVLYLNLQLTRLVGIHELFARFTAIAIAAIGLGILILVPLFTDGVYRIHSAFQIILLIILFLSIYSFIQNPLQRMTTRLFNRYGQQLEQAFDEIEKRLPEVISIESLDALILRRLHEAGRSQAISLYLWDHDHGVFHLKKSYTQQANPLLTAVGSEPFPKEFREGVILDLEQLRWHHPATSTLVRTMEQMEAEFSFPLWSDQVLAGWINIQSDPLSGGFSREELRHIKYIVDRAAIALETIRSINHLKEHHRLVALGTMSAGLAHEIRNPLAGIKGAAQYLQESPEPDEVQDFLQLIISEADRLNTVVSQFLDYSRPLQVNRQECDLNQLLQAAVEVLQADPQNSQIQYQFQLSAELQPISFDPIKIQQVIINLLQNASQAMEGSGTITVRSKLGRCVYQPHQGQPAAVFEVSDNGKGIPTDLKDQLFIPFFTTKQTGTGLGLPICQRLIEAHEGSLSVHSQVGQGSTFIVQLPILLQPEAS